MSVMYNESTQILCCGECCVCMCGRMHEEARCQGSSEIDVHLIVLKQGFFFNLQLAGLLVWLPITLWGSACLNLPRTRLEMCVNRPGFLHGCFLHEIPTQTPMLVK